MGKRSNWQGFAKRTLTDDDLSKRLKDDLEELSLLVRQYDDGHSLTYAQMTLVIHRVLVENLMGIRRRGKLKFPSNSFGPEGITGQPYHRLIAIRFSANPPSIDFVPHFQAGFLGQELKFADWWNQPVYRPSPISGTDHTVLPSEKNQGLNRRQVISAVRNKLAAHSDKEALLILEDLEKAYTWGLVELNVGGVTLSTADPDLRVSTPPLRAMAREIAQETLLAFGVLTA